MRRQITTKHIINASFSQGHFFEFVLQNPYSTDQNFEVSWDNTNLRIVTEVKEWKYHRTSNGIMLGVEHNMVQMRPDGTAQIFLGSNETISIPFIYQSMEEENALTQTDPNTRLLLNGDPVLSRVIHVSFLNIKKIPIAILDVVINPRNFYVDRCIRLFRCEHELVHKVIRYPISPSLPSTRDGSLMVQSTNEKFLRCNNPDVVCSQVEGKNDGNMKQIKFKYRVGTAPSLESLYFIFYNDAFCTSVHEIWRVFVHSIFRYVLR